jgi:type IV pilus assembly protein PilM
MVGSKARSVNKLVLDIGTSAVRLCELSKTKAGYQLNKYYQRGFDIDPAMDEEAKQDRRATVLGALLKEAKVRSRKAVVAVPGQSVFTRNRSLPPVPEYKVPQIVRYEIQQQIPFSLDEIALDYQVLGRTDVGGYDVMMAAIKVDVVEKQIEVLNKVKRSVEIVDVSPLAAYNWLCHTGDFGNDGACVAMVDLGATTTDIVIQKDNQFKFTRSLHVGGNDVTAALASAFNMSFLEAERLKCEKAFAPTGNAEQDGRGGEVTGRVLSRLVGEINRSFAYYRSQPGGGPVTRVVITGGGSCLRNIIPYLHRQLNIEVRIAQPLAGVAVTPNANEASQFPEQACVALGLALRCAQQVPVAVNLIPPRITEIDRRKDELKYWVATFIVIFAIMASAIPKTKNQNEQVKKEIEHYQSILGQYDPLLERDTNSRSPYENEMNLIKTELDGIKDEIDALQMISQQRNVWLDELEAVYNARPKGIAISSFQTAIIGEASNTGMPGRALTGTDAQAIVSTGGSGGTRPAPRNSDAPGFGSLLSLGGLAGLGGNVPSLAGNSSSGGAATITSITGGLYISPFPGIGVRAGVGAAKPVRGAVARSSGDDDDDDDDDRRGGRRGGSRTASTGIGLKQMNRASALQVDTSTPGSLVFSDKLIAEPNAIAIFGYASDVKKVQEFVERLKEEKHFIKDGVYFHINSLLKVPGSQLDQAGIGGLHSNSGPRAPAGRGSSGDDDDDDDRRGRGSKQGFLSSLAPGSQTQFGQPQGANAGFQVVQFQIELQLYGKTMQFDLGEIRDE